MYRNLADQLWIAGTGSSFVEPEQRLRSCRGDQHRQSVLTGQIYRIASLR